MAPGPRVRRFQSSDQKEVVRKQFQAPLIRHFQKRKQSLLKYFGLPGDDALDLKEWGDIVEEVVAVEFHEGRLRLLRERLEVSYGHIRYRTHHSDADAVILNNGCDSGGVGSTLPRITTLKRTALFGALTLCTLTTTGRSFRTIAGRCRLKTEHELSDISSQSIARMHGNLGC